MKKEKIKIENIALHAKKVQSAKHKNNRQKKLSCKNYKRSVWNEKTNCKIDVTETKDYTITGPPNIEEEKIKELMIEEQTETKVDFGIPEGEF